MGLFDKAEKKPDRFREKHTQGYQLGRISVFVDTETGVNYIFGYTGMDGGVTITPLIGPDGKVVVDEIGENLGKKIY